MKRNLVVFTGAGISASSGLATFRGANGLWEGYKIEEVATPEAWHKNPHLVTAFYNERRLSVAKAAPNLAHLQLKELESEWNVVIIIQNIDDLHERAGSKNVLHLHGEIMKMRSQRDENLLYDVDVNKLSMTLEDKCPFGLPWRPHVVWFGEAVPKMEEAIALTLTATIFLVIGTSLAVYPAASLLQYVPESAPILLLDPSADQLGVKRNFTAIVKSAEHGIVDVIEFLKKF